MNKLIVILFAAGALFMPGCCSTPHHANREHRQIMEYKVVHLSWGQHDSPDSQLNALAQQGWKIENSTISYVPYVYDGTFLFSRPRQ